MNLSVGLRCRAACIVQPAAQQRRPTENRFMEPILNSHRVQLSLLPQAVKTARGLQRDGNRFARWRGRHILPVLRRK